MSDKLFSLSLYRRRGGRTQEAANPKSEISLPLDTRERGLLLFAFRDKTQNAKSEIRNPQFEIQRVIDNSRCRRVAQG